MNKEVVKDGLSLFERIRQVDENENEFWSARELSKALEYSDYRNFEKVIEKAIEACLNSSQPKENHFVELNDMIEIGKGGKRAVNSLKMSRYACYLIVQNADPSKDVVANGQTYFAVQTRIAEIKQMEAYNQLASEDVKRIFLRNELIKHNIILAYAAKDAGVIKPVDYAIFQNHGFIGVIRKNAKEI